MISLPRMPYVSTTRLLTVFAFTLFLVSMANAQAKQDFTLHNETGRRIKEVYLSPTGEKDWADDMLGTAAEDEMATGTSREMKFVPSEKASRWDLKVVWMNGKSTVWTDLKITKTTDITLWYKDDMPTATSECRGKGCD